MLCGGRRRIRRSFAADCSLPMPDDARTQRLTRHPIELGKTDRNVAAYPVEPHGFRHPARWYDEYRRIPELFESERSP